MCFTLARLRAAARSHEIQDAVSSILSTLVVIDRQLFKFFSVIPSLELSGIQEMNALGELLLGEKPLFVSCIPGEKKRISYLVVFLRHFTLHVSRFT